jgi:hypothetical protein
MVSAFKVVFEAMLLSFPFHTRKSGNSEKKTENTPVAM